MSSTRNYNVSESGNIASHIDLILPLLPKTVRNRLSDKAASDIGKTSSAVRAEYIRRSEEQALKVLDASRKDEMKHTSEYLLSYVMIALAYHVACGKKKKAGGAPSYEKALIDKLFLSHEYAGVGSAAKKQAEREARKTFMGIYNFVKNMVNSYMDKMMEQDNVQVEDEEATDRPAEERSKVGGGRGKRSDRAAHMVSAGKVVYCDGYDDGVGIDAILLASSSVPEDGEDMIEDGATGSNSFEHSTAEATTQSHLSKEYYLWKSLVLNVAESNVSKRQAQQPAVGSAEKLGYNVDTIHDVAADLIIEEINKMVPT